MCHSMFSSIQKVNKFFFMYLAYINYDYWKMSNYISLTEDMVKTVGFSDSETSSDFEEDASGLPKDSDWTAVLVDEPYIPFLNESSTDINNAIH